MSNQADILRQIRDRLLQLKSYARSMLTMESKGAIVKELGEINKLFPDDLNLSFVVANVEKRLPDKIDVKLRDVQAFLTYYIPDEHPGLEYIENELRSIRTALSNFRESNKSRSVQDVKAGENGTEDSKAEENSRSGESQETSEAENTTEDSTTEDSGSSGGVKEERKNGGFLRSMVHRMRGKGSAVGGDMRCLLLELEALGMSIGETLLYAMQERHYIRFLMARFH